MYDALTRAALADELAGAFLAGPWAQDPLAEAGAACLDRWPSWMEALAMSLLAVYRTAPLGRRDEVARHITGFLAEHPVGRDGPEPPRILRLVRDDRVAGRVEAARPRLQHTWPIAQIGSVAELAARLELSDGQLAWLADIRGLERTVAQERLRNYRYRFLPRRHGLPRVLEAPKARLKEVQRWVLREILDPVPAHETAHGFIRGRSAISHASLHTGQQVVLRLDLRDFFASVAASRVYGIFRTLGYEPPVAHRLTGLTTNSIPRAVWAGFPRTSDPQLLQPRFWLGRQLATPHLPQGAPTSPGLANLAAFRLDRRLAGLAAASGLRYSRYADDLAFSGSQVLQRQRPRLEELVRRIAREEGFTLHEDKSALRTAASRQLVCGVVVNHHTNAPRAEYERLKAILHNASCDGPAAQNRSARPEFEAHLRGRVSWISALNPRRAEKLRRKFEEIDWSER